MIIGCGECGECVLWRVGPVDEKRSKEHQGGDVLPPHFSDVWLVGRAM